MNLSYLGDALDHWKGSLFECLRSTGALRRFAVDPMATDLDQWDDGDFSVLARLLRIKEHRIIRHKESFRHARANYLKEITHDGDLFLDPDTGIATGRCQQIEKYVKPEELARLLDSTSGRIVAVYQHVRARKTGERVDECVDAIKKKIAVFGWCSYESATVAMLFLSQSESRTRSIENTLKEFLGRHAERRVRSGSNTGQDL